MDLIKGVCSTGHDSLPHACRVSKFFLAKLMCVKATKPITSEEVLQEFESINKHGIHAARK
jgi:hypothetical protein